MSEEYGDYSVDDDNQLQPGDTLDDRGVDDVLDEGFTTREGWSPAQGYGNTPNEEARGESLDQRVAQEEPDFDFDHDTWSEDDTTDAEAGDRRSGRLVAPDQGVDPDTQQAQVADDVGIDGSAASAEEAAVHVIDN